MAFKIINDADLSGKGVIGQDDVPGLTPAEQQAKIEEVSRYAISVMNDNFNQAYTQEETNHAIDEKAMEAGGGDMYKAEFADGNGILLNTKIPKATSAETITGTSTTKFVTPAGLKSAIDAKLLQSVYTPNISGSVTAGTPTYASRSGSYIRSGQYCLANIAMQLTNKGGMSGSLKISLPFPSKYASAVTFGFIYNATLSSGYTLNGYTSLSDIQLTTSNGSTSTDLTAANISDGFYIGTLSCAYIVGDGY